MRLENIDQIRLLSTGDLEFGPGRENCHLDHDLSVRAETFQVANLRSLGFTYKELALPQDRTGSTYWRNSRAQLQEA
jgi:hypothetical protein